MPNPNAGRTNTSSDDSGLAIELVPRWEWRSFDYQLHLWQDALREARPAGRRPLTVETYVLSGKSPSDVKLRDGRVEVKQLMRTDASGLELWRPVLREEFPLAPGIFADLCDFWKIRCPDVCPLPPTPEHLLSFISRQVPDVRVIPVRKWRRGYRLHACVAERATVLVGGDLLEALSLEHADIATLFGVLRALHFDREQNTSFVLELKRLLGWSDEEAVR